jgi:nicotinamidase-related amidase
VRKDFPDFPSNLASTIETCRQCNAKIIWVRADYRHSHSPWLVQFERIHKGEMPPAPRLPCDPTFAECQWEDFATPQGPDMLITKTSWSSTTNTALTDLLRCAGIDTVLVCGLITSVCVQHSAFGIFEAGYRTLLVTDACADRGRARHEAALALYGDYMYELVTSEKLKSPTLGLVAAQPTTLVRDYVPKMAQQVQTFPRQLHHTPQEEEEYYTDSSMSKMLPIRHDNKQKCVILQQ